MPTNSESFKKIVDFTLGWEAGKTRDGKIREDGGLNSYDGSVTKWGIRQAAHPQVDVPNLTKEQAESIYYDNYWLPLSLDSQPMDVAAALFDTAVNLGVPRTKSFYKDRLTARDVIIQRVNWYFLLNERDPKKYGRFLKGWLARTNDLRKFCEILMQPTA